MHSFLLITKSPDTSVKEEDLSKKYHATIYPFEFKKIDDAKDLKKLLKLSFNTKTAILIKNIDESTVEAQSAFLKNLEEAQENIIFILTSRNINNILPTIISRCLIVDSSEVTGTNSINEKEIIEYEGLSLDQKFKYIEKIKDRSEAISFTENLMYFLSKDVIENCKRLNILLVTLSNLKANGNVSLQLTNMLVTS